MASIYSSRIGTAAIEARGREFYADLKKPRYLFSIAGMDRSFMPEQKGGKAFQILLTWLAYRYAGRDEWKTYISGDEAKQELQKGELKQWKAEE